jgi:hypothetical protein
VQEGAQLSNAISDVSGVTGLAIIRAILQGERDPFRLARLKDYRIQASEEEIARSLEGNWQKDVLFELQQAVEAYDPKNGSCLATLNKVRLVLLGMSDEKALTRIHPERESKRVGDEAGEGLLAAFQLPLLG